MQSDSDLRHAVDLVWDGAQRGIFYPQSLKGLLSDEQGYRVQLEILDRHLAAGERQAGWKVGLTAQAIQQQLGYFQPVFGFLLASGERASGCRLALGGLREPCFETELCLTVGRTLRGPGVSLEQARAALAGAAPAFEIVERRGDFVADLPLALADNAQQKHFVTGPALSPLPPGLVLGESRLELRINGRPVDQATGRAVLGDPAASVAWLANRLAGFGREVQAGMRIMSGSFTRQYAPNRGDRVEARFDPIGTVQVQFE